MKQRVIYVFTHDSIGLGEDGPTHQPIEQAMNLRGVPNLTVFRPADATETAEAWRAAIANTTGPTALLLTRQNLPTIDLTKYAPAAGVRRGGYVLWDSRPGKPDVILIGTGSELEVVMRAADTLAAEGIGVRVVSLPSWELYDAQDAAYRESVLPAACRARVAVEAGLRLGWERYVGLDGAVIGMDGFGASAPYQKLYEAFGITAEAVVARAKALLGK